MLYIRLSKTSNINYIIYNKQRMTADLDRSDETTYIRTLAKFDFLETILPKNNYNFFFIYGIDNQIRK